MTDELKIFIGKTLGLGLLALSLAIATWFVIGFSTWDYNILHWSDFLRSLIPAVAILGTTYYVHEQR